MFRRLLLRTLDGLGLLLVAALSLAVGVLGHLGTRPGLHTLTWAVHAATSARFKGSLEARRLDSLSLRGVRGLDARVLSPSGQPLAWVSGLDVDADLVGIAKGALFGDGPVKIRLERVAIDHLALDVSMVEGAGEPGERLLALADALLPRVPTPPAPNAGPPPTLDLASIHLHHAWVYGQVAETFAVDAEAQALDGAFFIDAKGLAVRVDSLAVSARNVLPNTVLTLRAKAHASLPNDGDRDVGAELTGDLASVPFVVTGELRGPAFEAHVAVPPTDAAKLTALVPSLALRGTLAVTAETKGQLEGSAVASAQAQLGAGRFDAHARAELGPERVANATFTAEDFELAAFAPNAPASRVGLTGGGRITFPKGGPLSAQLGVDLAPASHVAGQALPPVRVDAKLEPSGRAKVDLVAAEPGAPTTVHAELATKPGLGPLTFATSTALNLAALRRAGPLGSGAGTLTTEGTLDLATLALTARAELAAHALALRGVSVARVDAGVSARGSARALELHVTLGARRIRLGGKRALGRLDVESDVKVGPAILLQATHITARTHHETLSISAPAVSVEGTNFALQGVAIEGLGAKLYADGSRRGSKVAVRLRTEGDALDLARLARLVGEPELAGTLALDVDVKLDGAEAEGDVRVSLRDGKFPGLSRARLVVASSLHARRGHLALEAEVGDAITASANVRELELHGPALARESWMRAAGDGALLADIELARLHEALPGAMKDLPVRFVGGRGRVQAGFLHGPKGRLPTVSVAASTRGLVVAWAPKAPPPGTTATPAPSAAPLRGLELAAEALVDGTTGFTAISGRVTDARGPIISLDGKGELPLDLLLAGADTGALSAALLDRPFGLYVAAPTRNLSELHHFLDLGGTTGAASFALSIEGTPRAPRVALTLAGQNLKARGTGVASTLDATVRYDGKVAELDAILAANARARANAEATPGQVHLEARAEVDLSHLVEGRPPETLPWKADLSATFERFQLASLPSPQEARVRGTLDGKLTLCDLHRDAKVEVALDATAVTLAQAPIPHLAIRASAGGGLAKASVRVDQADGFAELVASVGLTWGAALVPKLDVAHALDARLQAKAFRAAALAPFVAQALTDLDGRVDADVRVRAGGGGESVVAEGSIVASDFGFVANAIGQEYRDVGARVTFAPGGVIRVEDLHASDGVGKITGAAIARLDNLTFVGANIALRVPDDHPIDMVLEGRTLGEAYGDIQISMRNLRATKTLDVAVDIPKLHVKLFETAGKQVQDLKPRTDVRIGIVRDRRLARLALVKPKAGPDEEVAAKDDSVTHVAVKLGRDVALRRGTMIVVQLTGAPEVRIAKGRTAVSGQLSLTGGSIDVSGRKFLVETGTITFGQDTTNPVVIATASWTAADRSRVFADFVGPVKTGKLSLRSEPARSQSEILTLIAFGSVDGPSDAASGSGKSPGQGTQLATTVGGGALTQGFDAALDDVVGIQTQTRIDSTNANNPRPELEVQVSRDVSLRFAYVLGTPPPSAPDKSLGTVIFRFAPNWSLSTTVGDKGKATVDTSWQYRY